MEIKKFDFKDLKKINSFLDSELTLGEHIASSQIHNSLNLDQEIINPIVTEPPELITKEESFKLCQEAFEQGKLEGLKFFEEQLKQKEVESLNESNLLLEKISTTLQGIEFNDSHQIFATNLKHIQELCITVAKKIAAKAINDNFIIIIENIIQKYISDLQTQKKIIIRINSHFKNLKEELLSKFSPIVDKDIDFQIILDDALNPYDVEIEWDNGLIQRNINQITKDVEVFLSNSIL